MITLSCCSHCCSRFCSLKALTLKALTFSHSVKFLWKRLHFGTIFWKRLHFVKTLSWKRLHFICTMYANESAYILRSSWKRLHYFSSSLHYIKKILICQYYENAFIKKSFLYDENAFIVKSLDKMIFIWYD